MNQRDIAALMEGIAPVLRGYVQKAFEPIGARVVEIERRIDGLPAPRDPDPVLILRLVEEAVAKIPPAPAGKDADPAMVAELVKEAISAIEPAKDGAPGSPGADGRDGADGNDGEPGQNGVDGKDGRDGQDGKDGSAGRDGVDGKDGLPGKDGEAGRDGRDGVPGAPGTPGKDGADGKDGRDGLGFEDMEAEFDGERTLTLRWAKGDVVKEVAINLPIPIDRGVWKEGQYARGDGVSFGGQFWIARRDTAEKPDFVEGNAWRLSVKKGRDGKDFRPDEKRASEPVKLK